MSNKLREIETLGQAVWIDNLNRDLLDDGTMRDLIEQDGISGVTSNPTIFERLALCDVRDAADLFKPTFDSTEGQDGYVSFELPASLAFDAQGSIDAAMRLHDLFERDNVLIKLPGTAEGVQAFEELTGRGVNVNITLLFAVERYREIAEAYIRGLQRRADAGEPVDRAASVASFFVSRVDTKVDAALEQLGREDLRGKAAIANARVAYAAFQEIFSGEAWERLSAVGANVQRPLWASTSTKNPDYPDTLYVDELIGPDTVNTMPDGTIEAARDHATPERTADKDIDGARALIDELKEIGVEFDDIVSRQLVDEGVASFSASYESLLETLERKAGELSAAAR